MKSIRAPATWLALMFLTACVTINVYFPAAAAEKAADRIIRDVYGDVPAEPAAPAEAPQPQTSAPLSVQMFAQVLEWVVPPAQAAADLSVQSPAIQNIQASMRDRHQQLAPYYDSGAVGMTGNGQVTLRDLNAVPLKDRRTVQQLVADENRDRSALYAEIARANGQPDWEDEIRSTFARRWVDNAPRGWWYQDGGAWKQK